MTRIMLPTLYRDQLSQDSLFPNLKQEILKDETNIDHWDALFRALQDKFEEQYDPKQPENITEELKSSITTSFSTLLTRFPYLGEHWRLWSVLEYKISGVDSSIKILEKSIQSHPFSLELWVDYISALISQYESNKTTEQLELLRTQYAQAIELNGHQFLSHPLWDKVIEFENSIEESSPEIMNLYKQVIKIPLYQYAQYYKQFVDINKNFKITDLLDQHQIDEYVSKFGKGTVKELSLIEKHQIIDDFSYSVFLKTQQAVNIKWGFESSITVHGFDLKLERDILDSQITSWKAYLDHEIKEFGDASGKTEQYESIKTLFERCLITHCLEPSIWLKYLAFLNKSVPKETRYDTMKEVYLRAITKFVPLDENFIRFNYSEFLLIHDGLESAVEYLLDVTKFFSGSELKTSVYMKEQYIETFTALLKLLKRASDAKSFQELCLRAIEEYFSEKTSKKRSQHPESSKTEDVIPKYRSRLFQQLNDESICVVTKFYLECLSLVEGEVLTVREFYNKFSQEVAFKRSTFFWLFFLEFEGFYQRNFINFEVILHYTRTQTQLPKLAIDSIIDWSYDLICTNFVQINQLNSNLDTLLISKNIEFSNSLIENQAARKRLAANNSITQQIEEQRSAKHNGPAVNKEEELLKILKKHAGSPGVFIESTPEITNSIMNEGTWIDLSDSKLSVPPYPYFKNVERASVPIHYPNDN